jgi:hypothetical protein
MLRFFAAAMLLALALVALPAPPPASAEKFNVPATAAPGAANPEFMGMAIRDPYYDFATNPDFPGQANQTFQDTMGRMLQQAGVRWVRLEFLADPDGHVNFDKYDYFIGTVAPKYDLKVLGVLATNIIRTWVRIGDKDVFYPILLNAESDSNTDPRYGSAVNQYMVEWLDEGLSIAARYDGSDPQAGRVHAFEIFNEMNRVLGDGTSLPQLPPPYTSPAYAGLDPARVARIHAKFYRICKNTDGLHAPARCPADTLIITGGLHPKGTSDRRTSSQPETFKWTDEQYLQEMYATAFIDYKKAQGAWPVDGVAFHPYPEEITPRPSVQGFLEDVYIKILPRVEQIRQMLKTVGDPNRPIWITEIGYNIAYWKAPKTGADQTQANFMREIYTSLAARGDIANVFWFKYEDFPPATGTNAQMWGIVRIHFEENNACSGGACYRVDGQPEIVRPAFYAYRELAGLPIYRTYTPWVSR